MVPEVWEGPYIGRRDDLGVRARVWKAGERLGGDRGVRLREGEDGPDSGAGLSVVAADARRERASRAER